MDFWHYEFMQHALVAGLLASVACGIIGVYVLVRKMVFLSGGIAHASFGGVGLAYFCGWNPVWGALGFSLVAALGINVLLYRFKNSVDTAMGIIWPLGMALGVCLLTRTHGYTADVFDVLFGNILMVSMTDLYRMLILDVVVMVCVVAFFKELQAISYDAEFAMVRALPVKMFQGLLLALTAVAIVMLMQVVGIILVMALLTLPAALSRFYTQRLTSMMALASILSFVFIVLGLLGSYYWGLPAGSFIVMCSCVVYLLAWLFRPKGVR